MWTDTLSSSYLSRRHRTMNSADAILETLQVADAADGAVEFFKKSLVDGRVDVCGWLFVTRWRF